MSDITTFSKCHTSFLTGEKISPNILNIQYISARKGRNNVRIPPKKPASVKAIITVQIWVIIAVIENMPNKDTKIAFILFLFKCE